MTSLRTLDADAGLSSTDAEPKWEKVLWRKQAFPDNYVPPTFLQELKDLRASFADPNITVSYELDLT